MIGIYKSIFNTKSYIKEIPKLNYKHVDTQHYWFQKNKLRDGSELGTLALLQSAEFISQNSWWATHNPLKLQLQVSTGTHKHMAHTHTVTDTQVKICLSDSCVKQETQLSFVIILPLVLDKILFSRN